MSLRCSISWCVLMLEFFYIQLLLKCYLLIPFYLKDVQAPFQLKLPRAAKKSSNWHPCQIKAVWEKWKQPELTEARAIVKTMPLVGVVGENNGSEKSSKQVLAKYLWEEHLTIRDCDAIFSYLPITSESRASGVDLSGCVDSNGSGRIYQEKLLNC